MRTEKKSAYKVYENLLLGAFVGLLSSFLLILILAVLLTVRDFSPAASLPIATVALGIGSFLSGFYAAYKNRQNGLLVGMASGGIYFLFYLVVALAMGGNFSMVSLVRAIVFLISSALGGVLGVNWSHRQKKV